MANLDPNLDPNRSYTNRNLDHRPVDRGVGTGGWIAGLLALILVVGAVFYMMNRSDTTVSSTNPSAPSMSSPASPPTTTGSGDASAPMRGPTTPPSPTTPAPAPKQ
jgi:hypothetical protein